MANAANKIQSHKRSAKKIGNNVSRTVKQQAKQIVGALHEAEQIHKGKRKGKSLDEFLKEL